MVEKTIIANMGEGDVGKTESIIMVYEKLINAKTIRKEIREIVTINKINIGIASEGDTREAVNGHLEYFKDNGCDIILIAGRANNPMVKLLKDFANDNAYRLWRTSNARIYEEVTRAAPQGIQHRFNDQWATEIANLIESWCYA